MSQLCFLLGFISAHVFSKEQWTRSLNRIGFDQFSAKGHFAFSYLLCEMNAEHPLWIWFPEPCMAQRLGNSCLIDELGEVEYAIQCSRDMRSLYLNILDSLPHSKALRKTLDHKLFLLYWNPVYILQYKSRGDLSLRSDANMLKFAIPIFFRDVQFLAFSLPVLLMPARVARGARGALAKARLWILKRPSIHLFLKSGLLKFLSWLGIQKQYAPSQAQSHAHENKARTDVELISATLPRLPE